jgi:CRISPR/Cas system-associated exonuclease Cas4 (RecB family)
MKRMLEVKDGKFYINSSSVDLIQTCKRKAQYALLDGYRSEDESEALTFGKAIHAALEEFYKTTDRQLAPILDAFMIAAAPLAHVPATDKRSIDNGVKILKRYFEVYENDPWVAYRDEKGAFVERSFEVPFMDHFIHGTVDAVLRNTETDELVLCDHKTATSLSDLANRVNPNLQFSIYIWALQRMNIPVKRAMINGIQVAKTKSDLVRIFTERNYQDFEEMFDSVHAAIQDYSSCYVAGKWPMNTSSCSHYGGCQYLEVCSLNKNLRPIAIEQIYGKI